MGHETSETKSHCTSIEASGSSTATPLTEQADEACNCKCQGQIKQLENEVLEARGEVTQRKKENKNEIAKLTPHEITKVRKEITKLKQQLEAAKFEITTLTQKLDEMNAEFSEYQKLAEKRKFCFSNIEGSVRDIYVVLHRFALSRCFLSITRLCEPRKKAIKHYLPCHCSTINK